MPTLSEELTALKTNEDKITGNKVANFAYDDYAYEHDDANGVDTYNVDAHQNIPNGTSSILKVNPTILTKGWRAQASAITRMLMNHFLGRVSYNLNKVNDHFSTLLTKLISYIGQPNGLATLDANGKVTVLNNVVNTGDSATPVSGGTTKFTTGGAYTLQQAVNGKAPTNHASTTNEYGEGTTSQFGHVKMNGKIYVKYQVYNSTGGMEFNLLNHQNCFLHFYNNTGSERAFKLYNGSGKQLSWLLIANNTVTAGHAVLSSSSEETITTVPTGGQILALITPASSTSVNWSANSTMHVPIVVDE